MANVLDQAEMDALRQTTDDKPAQRDVQQMRLVGQDHRLRSALALLTRAQSLTQEAVERAFMKLRQQPQRVDVAPVEISGPKVLQKLVREAATVCLLDSGNGGDDAYMLFDAPLAFELTDRSFGGSGVATPEDLKSITPLMRQNACELGSGIAAMLEECRGELWPQLRVKGPALRIDHVTQALSEREAVVMRWVIAEPLTTITLVLPASLLSLPQRGKLGPADNTAQKRLQEHVAEVEIELRVELGRAKVSMGRLLALTAGDVLRLDRGTNEPLLVCSDELKLLECRPNAVGDHVGLVFERWSGN